MTTKLKTTEEYAVKLKIIWIVKLKIIWINVKF